METVLKEIRIDTKSLKRISNIAKQENATENKVINDIIKKGLQRKEQEIDNTDNIGFKDLIGKYTTDEPFSAVEDKRKMRRGEL